MVTTGDIQFEPEQSKLWYFTTSIVAMISGDAALQTEILQDVEATVRERVTTKPDDWWNVKDVVDLYVHFYNAARLRRAELAYLTPLSLTYDTFIQRQKEMAPEFVGQLTVDLTNFQHRCGSLIFAGVDTTGAHLYTATDADARCRDAVGFAAIGAGRSHAASQFMFRKHSRQRGFSETLFLAYSAKKRAEVAPGVGRETDMFVIGPALGTFTTVDPRHLLRLEKLYQTNWRREGRARLQAEESVKKYLSMIGADATKKQGEIPDNRAENESDDQEIVDTPGSD